MKTGNPLAFSARIDHLALVTHAVPASRVRAHLPRGFELETFRHDWYGAETELAFVSVAGFRNEGLHWKPLLLPRLSFEQITYRTYVRYRGRQGVYFFATYIGSMSGFAIEGPLFQNAYPGEIRSYRGPSDEDALRIRTEVSSRRGDTSFQIRFDGKSFADPSQSGFLTERHHGFFRSSLGGQLDAMVSHRRMRPLAGELLSGCFGIWEKMGILFASEALPAAWSVLLEPVIDFDFYPPFPARLLIEDLRFSPEQEHRLHH